MSNHSSLDRRAPFVIVLATFLTLAVATPGLAQRQGDDLSFLDGLSLVVLDTGDIASLHAARALVTSYGGTIAIMSPPSLLIGWIPYEVREALVSEAGIRDVYYTEVAPSELPDMDEPSRAMVRFFNRAVRGDLTEQYRRQQASARAEPQESSRASDVRETPALEADAYIKNLAGVGLDIGRLRSDGLLLTSPGTPTPTLGNSDFMTGTCALTVFFVESDGSGSDPDLYTWTPEDMQTYLDGVALGLAFWSSEAAFVSGCGITWLINYCSGADPRCQQWTEPILHASSWEGTWINEIMSNFGFTSGGYFTRVTSFNTWQRSTYQTDRAYSAFVPYNPPPAPAFFSDSHTAYAYLGGPFTVLLFNVQGWGVSQVFAHESGHIFYACDEYAGGCSSCSASCGNGLANANCETCNVNTRDCMMKANSFALCQYTPTHVGWGANNPCNPPPPPALAAPTLGTSAPGSGLQGLTQTITLTGTNFFAGATVDFGGDIFVDVYTLNSSSSLTIDVTILNSAPLGLRNVTVTNRDGQSVTLINAFDILPTTRHYYSQTGGNQFPYVTPADAATTLVDAIAAAFDGDTLYVTSGTLPNTTLSLNPGVLLHGAWNSTFTQRDLVSGKTILNLAGNVAINPTATGGGLDGFVVQNGGGQLSVTPFPAYFGGGIQILSSAATIVNCEIRLNAASTGTNDGVGGGIFAHNCNVDFRNNLIEQNTATQGGGIYLLNCSGILADNTISANSVSFATLAHQGAGIMLVDCAGITLTGNTISGNTGSIDGGGMQIVNSSLITIDGGTVSGNDASTSGFGAGINIDGSTVTITGVTISGNTSGLIAGGIAATNGSIISVIECSLVSNSALVGGGVYATGGEAWIQHNLFKANNASVSDAALSLGSPTAGVVAGNTLDANTSAGVAGAALSNAAIEVYNNIIVNSTGTGLSCTGAPLPVNSYNLIWNNSGGDYSGCAAGLGARSTDPLFANAGVGDYHLALHSPAIDAGKPGASFDDPDGSRGDVGRYGSHTFIMEQPAYPKNLQAAIDAGQVALTWNRSAEGDVVSYAIYCDSSSGFIPSAANFVALAPAADSTATLGAPTDSAFYRIVAVDTAGYASGYSNEATYSQPTGIGDDLARVRDQLHQNVPNPFNPTTRIRYELRARTSVTLDVYNVDGRLVRSLVRAVQGPGTFAAEWDGSNTTGSRVASGIYFYRLTAGAYVKTRKMLLLK